MGGKRFLGAALLAIALSGCAVRAAYDDIDLDSGRHPVLVAPLSVRQPHPTAAELNRPVVVATHGFSSTVWEIGLIAEALEKRGVQVSPVTLGAHGTSLADFAASDWRVWREPLIAEYRSLRAQGYKHVSVFGHSTGATLWLEALADGRLGSVPERMVFVAPLIEFSSLTRGVYFAGILPWFGVERIERPLRGDSVGHLYRYRPVSSMTTLTEVTTRVRRRLETGLPLPASTRVLVVQGNQDEVVEPAAAKLLVSGLVGPTTKLMMVDSWMHNPVGPEGIQGHMFTPSEAALREKLLGAIGDHLAN